MAGEAERPLTLPTVSVVLPTHNRRRLLERVLEPLLAAPDAHEIVIVVDGCRDGSLELLEALAAGDARVRPLWIENRGMGGARRYGVEQAGGEVVLLIDDDVVLAPHAILGHARHHARERGLVVVGSMPVADGAQRGAREYPRAIYAAEYRRHVARWLRDPETVLETLWAGHLSLRRADFLGLDAPVSEALARGYHSDIDFGLRCRQAGLRGRFDPALGAVHLYERSPKAFLADARSSGASLALAHGAHTRAIGELDPDRTLAGLPGPARLLVRRARTARWPRRALAALVPALGGLRWYRAQRFAAGLRWRVEQDRAIAAGRAGATGETS